MFTDSNQWKIIKTKADLLCMGLRPNKTAEEIYKKQNPCNDWKTGNVGVHILLENTTHALVTISHSFDLNSPYSLENIDGETFLCKDKKIVNNVKAVPMPNWYKKRTKTSQLMPTFFLHEGKSFLHQAYAGCAFHSIGLACQYCGAGSGIKIGTPEEVAETVLEAVGENSTYHVCLGGGTRLPFDLNVEYFSHCIRMIRETNKQVPIWVEMIPPDEAGIERLIDDGATSFGFNIEIWNNKLRKKICPGKSKIAKKHYLKSMSYALDVLGPNRVGSCLIAGLEPIGDSIEGAITLTSHGVQPCILPFKPWDKSLLKDHTHSTTDQLIEVAVATVESMIKFGINPEKNHGCLLCEGCTIDHDIYKLKTIN